MADAIPATKADAAPVDKRPEPHLDSPPAPRPERRILYVDRNPMSWNNRESQREYWRRETRMGLALADDYHVDAVYNILEVTPDDVKQCRADLLLTHLQETQYHDGRYKNLTMMTYKRSMKSILAIRVAMPKLPILVYTGAGTSAATDDDLRRHGASAVLRKLSIGNLEREIVLVKQTIDSLLR